MRDLHESNTQGQTSRFIVRIGHVQTMVEGRTRDEAIRMARRQLGCEMPRMWDVIYRIDEGHFEVKPGE